jgi:hypothetical protein
MEAALKQDARGKARGRLVRRRRRPIAPAWLACLVASCGPARSPLPEPSWEYVVDAPADGSRVLSVRARFTSSGTDALLISDTASPLVRDLLVDTGQGMHPATRTGSQWTIPGCSVRCSVRYTVDLGALAAACDDAMSGASRVGDAILSPAMTWLLHPEPNGDAPVTLRLRGGEPGQVLTGLAPVPGTPDLYTFRSPDLDEGAFTAFGPMRQARLDVRGGVIDLAILGGPLAIADDALRAWIAGAASVASSLFDRFPVEHAAVFVVPAHGRDEVVFGKVLSLSGASVALLVGDAMTEADAHRDWVAVHELFHLGFPSFRGEGRWLEEGLAIYYEPILRTRAGWITEGEMWGDFVRNLPRGLPQGASDPGLERRADLDGMYWGGALFAFLADVEIRRATRGRHSLDDVLRAALQRGGNATRVWRVADVLRLGDEITGTKILSDLHARHALRAEPIDLAGLLDNLGVIPADVRAAGLRDDKPMSTIRKAIVARQ